MKNIITIFLLLSLLLNLCACSFAENKDLQGSEEELLRKEVHLKKVLDIDLSKFKLCDLANDFINIKEMEFKGKYNIDTLYKKGVKMEGGLRFTNRFEDNIIGNLKMGMNTEEFIQNIGQPNIKNEKIELLGYKTEKYYLIIKGNKKVEEVSFIKRDFISKDYKNLLYDFVKNGEEKGYYTSYDTFMEKYHKYLSKSHIRGGGWLVRYPGIEFELFDEIKIRVYNDFDGTLVKENKNVKITYIDKDFVFKGEEIYYSWEEILQKEIQKNGILSPYKKYLAYKEDGGTYENASILIRYCDYSKADERIYPGYFVDNLKWISDRYLFFTAGFKGLFLYDVKNSQSINLIDRLEGEEVYPEYELKSIDSNSIQYINEHGEKIILNYEFDDEGNINIRNKKNNKENNKDKVKKG
ncbi:hypothetical protein [Anaerophilus nitritogenes]|uniref:hypothetical protein n=1 Tax=Anaerophilus nitritogenes TaxID=2498136 RepID=UPI00101CF2F8|nr:hypothetical protein [Anaerophilus nitritogenes]